MIECPDCGNTMPENEEVECSKCGSRFRKLSKNKKPKNRYLITELPKAGVKLMRIPDENQ